MGLFCSYVGAQGRAQIRGAAGCRVLGRQILQQARRSPEEYAATVRRQARPILIDHGKPVRHQPL